MAKTNYARTLEELSDIVFLSFEGYRRTPLATFDLRERFLEELSALENSLLEDFLPPFERESMAEFAYSLLEILDLSAYHSSLFIDTRSRASYTELSRIIKDTARLLKNAKKAEIAPQIKAFRSSQSKYILSTHKASDPFFQYQIYLSLSKSFGALIKLFLKSI